MFLCFNRHVLSTFPLGYVTSTSPWHTPAVYGFVTLGASGNLLAYNSVQAATEAGNWICNSKCKTPIRVRDGKSYEHVDLKFTTIADKKYEKL